MFQFATSQLYFNFRKFTKPRAFAEDEDEKENNIFNDSHCPIRFIEIVVKLIDLIHFFWVIFLFGNDYQFYISFPFDSLTFTEELLVMGFLFLRNQNLFLD